MRTEKLNYYLPSELIAQLPIAVRSDSRLLVLDRSAGDISDSRFSKIGDFLSPGDCLVLNLAAFCHDLGKGVCRTEDAGGMVHFYGHHEASARMVRDIAARFDFGPRMARRVERLVEHHMKVLRCVVKGYDEEYFRKLAFLMRDDLPLLVLLALADKLAARGARSRDTLAKVISVGRDLLHFHRCGRSRVDGLPKLLGGREVMEALGLEPGIPVGEVLVVLKEAQYRGEVTTRAEALDFVRTIDLQKYLRRSVLYRRQNATETT